MSSSPTKTTFFRRLVFAAAPLVVLLLVWPATRAHADIFSVFTDLFNTVTSTLGGPSSAIDNASSQQLQFLTNTIYPQSLIDQVHSSISTTSSTYRPWMASVMALPTNSATAVSSRQLESAMRGGSSVPPSQLQTSFQATYGSPVTAKGAAPFTQTVTDMSDSQALDVFSLTSASDFTANTLISQSHLVEDTGAAVAPGNADHAALQAKALELYSAAIRHKLLAANLRLESVELANTTGAIKQQMVHPVPASTYLVSGSSASSTAGTSGGANNQTSTQTAK
jgi:hypothetical protein